MVWIQKPPLWTPINWGCRLADKLQYAWLLNESGGTKIIDTVHNQSLTINGTPPGWYADGSFSFDGTSGKYLSWPSQIGGGWNELSFFAQFMPIGWGESSYGRIISCKTLSPSRGYEFYLQNGGAEATIYSQIFSSNYSTDSYDAVSTAGKITLGNKYNALVTYANGEGIKLYLGGILIDSDAVGDAGTVGTSTGVFDIGIRAFDLLRYFNGRIYLVYIWNRRLRPEEVFELHVNPYAIFEQPRMGKWFYAAAQPAYQPWAQMGPILAQ